MSERGAFMTSVICDERPEVLEVLRRELRSVTDRDDDLHELPGPFFCGFVRGGHAGHEVEIVGAAALQIAAFLPAGAGCITLVVVHEGRDLTTEYEILGGAVKARSLQWEMNLSDPNGMSH